LVRAIKKKNEVNSAGATLAQFNGGRVRGSKEFGADYLAEKRSEDPRRSTFPRIKYKKTDELGESQGEQNAGSSSKGDSVTKEDCNP